MRFSREHKTYNEWLADNRRDTPYTRRIKRLHEKHPDVTLSQLRGHARENEVPLWVLGMSMRTPKYVSDLARMAEEFAQATGMVEYDNKRRVKPGGGRRMNRGKYNVKLHRRAKNEP